MTRGQKLTREEVLEKKRRAERARYERIKRDPKKYEEQREKERLKYLKKKESGKIRAAKDMTPRENRAARKRWRENLAAYRKRQRAKQIDTLRFLRENTPTSSADERSFIEQNGEQLAEQNSRDNNIMNKIKSAAQKRSERLRREKNKLLTKKDKEIKMLKRKLEKYKKRLLRAKEKQNRNKPLTPQTKVKHLICNPSPEAKQQVTKNLLFGEVMKQQLNENYLSLRSSQEKRIFAKVVTGRIVKKYKVWKDIGNISAKQVKKACKTKSLLGYKRKTRKDNIVRKVKNSVINFLEEDTNTRLCPGKKDYITKNKIKKQKRLLLDTLKNLHKKYLARHPNVKLGYALFCKLKPFWIMQPKQSDRDTCLCVIHSNFDLILQSLFIPNIARVRNYQHFLEQVCCDRYNEECLSRQCNTCRFKHIHYKEFDNSILITLKQWTVLSEILIDGKTQNARKIRKYSKKSSPLPPKDVIALLESKMDIFFKHQLNIVHQYNFIKLLKENLTEEECIIHMDFSENYNTKFGEEIQAFHFGGSRTQISIHTVVVYMRNYDKSLSTSCHCSLSNNLAHGPAAIWAHLKPIFGFIPSEITNVHFISDGPVTQYRNKSMFFILATQLRIFFPNINRFSWNFHEAGHGKGAPDGVGAVCKRTADDCVRKGKDVSTLDLLAKIIKEKCPSIKSYIISSCDIENIAVILKKNENNILSFPGTLQVHQVVGNSPNKLVFKSLSCYCSKEGCCHFKLGELDYSNHCTKTSKLAVDEIYSDSDNEVQLENEIKSITAQKQDTLSKCNNSDVTGTSGVSSSCYMPGDYVLVKLDAKKTEYRYVAVCSGEVDEDEGEIKVTFLKLCNDNGTLFKINDADISYISLDQILTLLPIPALVLKGDRCFYKFSESVDVFEQ